MVYHTVKPSSLLQTQVSLLKISETSLFLCISALQSPPPQAYSWKRMMVNKVVVATETNTYGRSTKQRSLLPVSSTADDEVTVSGSELPGRGVQPLCHITNSMSQFYGVFPNICKGPQQSSGSKRSGLRNMDNEMNVAVDLKTTQFQLFFQPIIIGAGGRGGVNSGRRPVIIMNPLCYVSLKTYRHIDICIHVCVRVCFPLNVSECLTSSSFVCSSCNSFWLVPCFCTLLLSDWLFSSACSLTSDSDWSL